jgi:hypothetical protein
LRYHEGVSKELVQQLAPVLWDVDPTTVEPEEPKALAFCAAVFHRPRESFRCYTSRRSPHGRWPS